MIDSRPRLGVLIASGMVVLVGGCADGYYGQSIGGHLRLMGDRQDIATLVTEPSTPPDLAARLSLVTDIVSYAHDQLALPDNGSYRSFVDVDRAYVAWNVIAAPELSLTPIEWCFPVVGCVTYRGYFDEAEAVAYGDGLRAEGNDVLVAGTRAYSTLGWFDDPVPGTILYDPDYVLAGTIFHELAHQRVYITDDTMFNESHASAVELAGVELWLADHGTPELRTAFRQRHLRQDQFLRLVQETRSERETLYQTPLDPETMLAHKSDIYASLRAGYARLRASWGGYSGYDLWFTQDLNNAKLALVATYTLLTDSFLELLASVDGDWSAFHDAVEALAELPRAERDLALAQLAGR
ncbi:MAG: aminopeptidase [Alphaproteobacteria bacterium]